MTKRKIHADAVALVDHWFKSYESIVGSKCPYEGRKYMGYLGMMKTLLEQYPKEEIEKRMEGALRHEFLTGLPGSIYDFKEGFGKYVDSNRPGRQQVRQAVVL